MAESPKLSIPDLLALPEQQWTKALAIAVLQEIARGRLSGRNVGKVVTKAKRVLDTEEVDLGEVVFAPGPRRTG